MIDVFRRSYNKILNNFLKDVGQKKEGDHQDTNLKDNQEYVGALSFYITKDKEIDIACSFPELTNKTTEDIRELSEIYAEFLVYINEGYLKDDIVSIIDTKDNDKNLTEEQQAKNRLYIENIMFSWAMFHVENLKRKKNLAKYNQPLIRPISVFSGQ